MMLLNFWFLLLKNAVRIRWRDCWFESRQTTRYITDIHKRSLYYLNEGECHLTKKAYHAQLGLPDKDLAIVDIICICFHITIQIVLKYTKPFL